MCIRHVRSLALGPPLGGVAPRFSSLLALVPLRAPPVPHCIVITPAASTKGNCYVPLAQQIPCHHPYLTEGPSKAQLGSQGGQDVTPGYLTSGQGSLGCGWSRASPATPNSQPSSPPEVLQAGSVLWEPLSSPGAASPLAGQEKAPGFPC